ncbi:hypothetical protein [Spirosoma jeollabukense]
MRIFCWFLVILAFSCQESKQKMADSPDAVRDLLIDRSFWKSNALSTTGGNRINMHRFTITNTSHKYTYRNIEVRFDYYDSSHRKIDTAKRIVDQSVEPRAATQINDIKADLSKPGVTSATVTVISASVN